MRNGSVCPMPPAVVIRPVAAPRIQGDPRPVSEPSSDKASAKPIEMPAPTEAARPTRKASQLLCVAKAAAKSGARVETEPPSSRQGLAGPLATKTACGATHLPALALAG